MVYPYKDLKYAELLGLNQKLAKELQSDKSYKISIISNVIVSQFKEILEVALRSKSINAQVSIGDYDNIVQNSNKISDSDVVIILWELSNLVDGFHYKIETMTEGEINNLVTKTKQEIQLVFQNLNDVSLVIINEFSAEFFCSDSFGNHRYQDLADDLNNFLRSELPKNFRLNKTKSVIVKEGLNRSLDMRFYLSSKAPYTIDFFKNMAGLLMPSIMAATGKSKKILIFDCDNTLWKGVLGEDGFDGVKMSDSYPGSVFREIQSLAYGLTKKGILIGLCSKNNASDVQQVIDTHPDFLLSDSDITIKKINWTDKASNLKAMATELNIGLDSFVFVDDSDFETSLIREKLPEVTVLQVPKKLHEYPGLIRRNLDLFFNLSQTTEDKKRAKMYREQVMRQEVLEEFSNIEDYLMSLELKLDIFFNDHNKIARMSQMTQKTNQFNLTTKRYTEADIHKFVEEIDKDAVAISVSDKFGDSGITGLCLLDNVDGEVAEIDSLLLSCRVLGRNIEFACLDYVLTYLKQNGFKYVRARYCKTRKNEQVCEFYEKLSFDVVSSSDSEKSYILDLHNYQPNAIDYIELNNYGR